MSGATATTRAEGHAPESRACRACRVWDRRSDDDYCSSCGHLLLDIEVHPPTLTLVAPSAARRTLSIQSADHHPLRVAFALPPDVATFLTCQPASVELVDGAPVQVEAILDLSRLPASAHFDTNLRLVVNDDPRKQLVVPVTIHAGPRPVASVAALDFGEAEKGRATSAELSVANRGGRPLTIRAVALSDCPGLRIAESPPPEIVLEPDAAHAFVVAWDQPEAVLGAQAAVRLEFADEGLPPLEVPIRGRVASTSITLDPAEVVFTPVPRLSADSRIAPWHYAHVTPVILANGGTRDVKVMAFESKPHWLSVAPQRSGVTLVAPAGVESADAASLGPRAVNCTVDVVARPRDLPLGTSSGDVTVHTSDPGLTFDLPVRVQVVESEEAPEYLGVDFGTSNSVVAVYDLEAGDFILAEQPAEQNPPRNAEDEGTPLRATLIPSVLYLSGSPDNCLLGRLAEARAATDSSNAVRSVKRIMGNSRKRSIHGAQLLPEDQAARIIRKLIELTEAQVYVRTGRYKTYRHAIATVPANFYDLQIRAILRACELAGLDTEEEATQRAARELKSALGREVSTGIILDEPSAAALYYLWLIGYDKLGSASAALREIDAQVDRGGQVHLLVFDCGGGTLDVSVVRVVRVERAGKRGYGLSVCANLGDNAIGGDSIDIALMKHLLKQCPDQALDRSLIESTGKNIDERAQRERWANDAKDSVSNARDGWKKAAEAAKIALSQSDAANFSIPPACILSVDEHARVSRTQGPAFTHRVSRQELELELERFLDGAETLVRRALDLAGTEPDRIDFLLHTGRTSFIPAMRKRVRNIFRALPDDHDILDPSQLKVCVAMGAALYGMLRTTPLADQDGGVYFLSEGRSLAHAYGLARQVGFGRLEFETLIDRGQSYPVEHSREIDLHAPHTVLTFYQNSGKEKTIHGNRDVRMIGQAVVHDDDGRKCKCQVRIVIDANRKLEVFADGEPVTIRPAQLEPEEGWQA